MFKALSLYIHWPFCLSKCPYCDFNSHVNADVDHQLWLKCYLKEIDNFTDVFEGKILKTIFFGGGTPSLMKPFVIEGVLKHLAKIITFANDIEITIEANPTSFERDKFIDFSQAGVNRVSIGVQSLIDDELKYLGRAHSASLAVKAIESANKIFDRVSFDLIYARNKQSLQDWQNELRMALELSSGHISLYQLTIEKGTEFYRAFKQNSLVMPSNDSAADMYEITNEILGKHDYKRYEISNYAKAGQECRHNLSYWHYREYLGIGPGAHSRLHIDSKIQSLMMWHRPQKWLDQVFNSLGSVQSDKILSKQEVVEEILMMGLRLEEGLNLEAFKYITDSNLIDHLNQEIIFQYNALGLVELNDKFLRLTSKGLLLHSYIVPRLLLS